MVCLPAIAATAYFVSVILLDLYNRNWNQVPGHALFGVFATLLILFICQKASETVAWILLAAPFAFILLGYLVTLWSSSNATEQQPSSEPSCPCPCCHFKRCQCRRPCWRPKPACPKCPDCPAPKPKPKPDNCIKSSLADE